MKLTNIVMFSVIFQTIVLSTAVETEVARGLLSEIGKDSPLLNKEMAQILDKASLLWGNETKASWRAVHQGSLSFVGKICFDENVCWASKS